MGEDEWVVRGEPMPSPGPFNLYMYDGAHEHEDQAKAFYHYDSQLTDVFIAVIDDWNYFPVQTGTYAVSLLAQMMPPLELRPLFDPAPSPPSAPSPPTSPPRLLM